MKVVQEENLSQVDHHMESRYQIEPMSCLFFMLRHADLRIRFTYILFFKSTSNPYQKPAFAGFFHPYQDYALRFAKSSIKLTSA